MHVEYHKFYSQNLGRDMEFKIYGHTGKPMMVFPSSGGRFYEYEDFGMVEALSGFIGAGHIRIVAVDSIDKESWLNKGADSEERGQRHNAYDRYIVDELIPFLKHHFGYGGGFIATGCSMGGFQSLNFLLRHPDAFDGVIALSGIYDARFFVGEHFGYSVYVNSPVDYLRNLDDPWYLERYRRADIILCVGQGAWEEDSIRDTRAMDAIFREKGIPAWVDYWGYEVDHDWPWWRVQIVHFVDRLFDYYDRKG